MSYEYRPGTPIDPKDIRVGDRVRLVSAHNDEHVLLEEWVVRRPELLIDGPRRTFELIERPRPEFKPGQVWEFPGLGGTMRYLIVTLVGDLRALRIGGNYVTNPAFLHEDGHDLTYVGEAEITVKP